MSRGYAQIFILLAILALAVSGSFRAYKLITQPPSLETPAPQQESQGSPSPSAQTPPKASQPPPTPQPPVPAPTPTPSPKSNEDDAVSSDLPPVLGPEPEPALSPEPTPEPESEPAAPPPTFLVKPYLVYPADKPMEPAYETAVNSYLAELQQWYVDKIGATFSMQPLEVKRSSYNYLTMRCGENPSQSCIDDSSKLEGNWGAFMNKAVHDGVERWEEETAALIFSAGGGGFAGANQYANYTGFAITGDWVLEPISRVANSWGIPCSSSDGWQCAGGVPKGSPAHELGHAFGLPHPGEQYAGQSIMQWHGDYPGVGFIQQEIDFLLTSPFFQ